MRSSVHCLALLAVAVMSATGMALDLGCGSSAPPATTCNDDPFQCGKGQTCWPQQCTCPPGTSCDPTDCTPQFQCLAGADKQAGDPCQLTIGQVTCGELQTCVELRDSGGGGTCRDYCDPGDPRRGCVSGFQCVALGVGGSASVESVCVPAPADEDASLGIDVPSSDDAGYYDPDALPMQPDVLADTGQHTM
jgi:hypothetical protein